VTTVTLARPRGWSRAAGRAPPQTGHVPLSWPARHEAPHSATGVRGGEAVPTACGHEAGAWRGVGCGDEVPGAAHVWRRSWSVACLSLKVP
jgi:hypothetical protein